MYCLSVASPFGLFEFKGPLQHLVRKSCEELLNGQDLVEALVLEEDKGEREAVKAIALNECQTEMVYALVMRTR